MSRTATSMYLIGYNIFQAIGWMYVLYKSIRGTFHETSLAGAMPEASFAVGTFLCLITHESVDFLIRIPVGHGHTRYTYVMIDAALFQLISFMEILHAALGIVRGSPAAAFLQWTGRANVLFAVILAIPQIKSGVAAGAMVIAWSVSEVIRYPWYAANLIGTGPFWLTWLRYTMFIPLYPIGVVGEMVSIYNALPILQKNKMYCIELPNRWNFGFDYAIFMKISLLMYPFLWWQLYGMLLRQRAKRLSGTPSIAKKRV